MSGDSDLDSAKQRIGQVIRGKYRIDRVLGDGGMATVFAATHRNQKQFAIKILHPELSHQAEIRTRFLREGYAANSVRHPGAVAVLDDDITDDGAAFLVMELLEGKTVEDLAEKTGGRLPAVSVLAIAHALLDVLAAAHAQGIVHRDIKPANVFVTNDGQVKVLDFGIARVRDAASGNANVTGTGLLLGTPAFMSPEQALGKSTEIGPPTDIWAVGATLFTVLTGTPVHAGETGQHMMILAATQQARSLGATDPRMPPPIVAVVDRALQFDRERRWPTAESMRDAVRDASLSVFGRLPLRDALLLLIGARPDPLAPTRSIEAMTAPMPATSPTAPPGMASTVLPGASPTPPPPGPGRLSSPPVQPTMPMAAIPASALGGTDARYGIGMTTSQPVSNDAPISLPAGVPRSRGPVLGLAAVGGVLLVGGAAIFGLRAMSAPAQPPATAAETTPSAPTTDLAVLAPSSAPEHEAPAPEATPAPHPAMAAIAAPVPAAANATAARPGHPAASASVAPPAPPPPVASAAAPPPAASAAPVCRLVSFFDSDGNKHFKEECH